jgi:CheY-like chemotaxis protein
MKHCILYVEDEEADVFLFQRACKKAGLESPVNAVSDGQIAIDYLSGTGGFGDRRQHPMPTLILLDLKLPRLSGFEFLDWLRRQPKLRTLVVVVFSSSADPRDVQRAYELGANSFIQKPSDLEQTVELARLFKAWWLDRNRFPASHELPPQSLSRAA